MERPPVGFIYPPVFDRHILNGADVLKIKAPITKPPNIRLSTVALTSASLSDVSLILPLLFNLHVDLG